jgi:ASC-1-like (ASCH) protein
MHHTMNLYADSFAKVLSGTKKSELRLNDEKRQQIHVGDTITFRNAASEDETIDTEVTYLKTYPNFASLFDGMQHDYPNCQKESFIQGMYQYYTPAKELRYGALEIGIRVLNV